MPGPYISLMVLRRRASRRSGAGRAVRGRKTQDSADAALIRLFTSNKDSGTRRTVRRVPLSRADPSVSRAHAGIVISARNLGYDSSLEHSSSEPNT